MNNLCDGIYEIYNVTCKTVKMHGCVFTHTASVAEWLRAWDTLTMFEATVCGRS